MGYVASVDNAEPRTLRRAMLYGTVTASLCVEAFSFDGLRQSSRARVESRFNELLAMVSP